MSALRRTGRRCLVLSNNSSMSQEAYCRKLRGFGLSVDPEDLFTSTAATIIYLRREGLQRVYPLAVPEVEQEFAAAGLELTGERPDAVVLTFDKTLTYEKLQTACRCILDGARFVCTHPDVVCPTETLPIPDCGAIARAVIAATGVSPQIIGKPNDTMVQAALARLGAAPEDAAVVGDRLYTDMEMGFRAGLYTILVLSGETRPEDLAGAPRQPDCVVSSVGELADRIAAFGPLTPGSSAP